MHLKVWICPCKPNSQRLSTREQYVAILKATLEELADALCRLAYDEGLPQPFRIKFRDQGRLHSRVAELWTCANEERLAWLKDAIHQAGFRLIAAHSSDDAWMKTDFFDFGCVVIDYDLKNDIAASAFGQRFIMVNLGEGAAPETLVLELTSLFSRGSELVQ